MKPPTMEIVWYQLEEKMGDGSWARVYNQDEEDPAYLRFETKELAKEYAMTQGHKNHGWSAKTLQMGAVRIVAVRTTVTPLECEWK